MENFEKRQVLYGKENYLGWSKVTNAILASKGLLCGTRFCDKKYFVLIFRITTPSRYNG